MKYENKQNNIAFLFGAGAEVGYGLPLGPEYTDKTMLCKRSKMYDALEEYYKKENVERYKKEFMFSKSSTTFFEIIKSAVEQCDKEENIDEQTQLLQKEYILYQNNKDNSKLKSYIKDNVYDEIIKDIDDTSNSSIKYKSLRKNLCYYGSIEKDFSVIANREIAGIKRFWRLINYFWGCYFSIVIPLLKKVEKHRGKVELEDRYSYILSNLYEISSLFIDIENGKDCGIFLEDRYNYYKTIKKAFPYSYALTTNYTPFVSYYWGTENVSYLAGKLSEFEIPDELDVVQYTDEMQFENKLIFPYMATQAPIKPIVHRRQLDEYNKAIKFLDEVDTLVVIGYNINENDNHINSLLRGYVTRNKKIIFCKYQEKKDFFDEAKEHEIVCNKLKLRYDNVRSNIKVIENNGNINDLLERL